MTALSGHAPGSALALRPEPEGRPASQTRGLDAQWCYRAVASRDARFDGCFITAVRTTGIFCRPSCPARTPAPGNVEFFRTAAAAVARGYRACRRCRPDAVPGSPEWNVREDVVARAMRLVEDGGVERLGVAGVADELGYSERQLNRLVTAELGAGLAAIARVRRAELARTLLEGSDLPVAEVAWAAGFGSIRTFNATVAATFATTPRELRRVGRRSGAAGGEGRSRPRGGSRAGRLGRVGAGDSRTRAPSGVISTTLAVRQPFAGASLLAFLGKRAVPGCEFWDGDEYRRALRLPRGHGIVSCRVDGSGVAAQFRLTDLRDLPSAVARVRRMLDLDADPRAVAAVLGADPLLAETVRRRPGMRLPGCVDPDEALVRAIVGQQVSTVGARTVLGRMVAEHGDLVGIADPEITHVFPSMTRLATIADDSLPMPRARARTIAQAAAAREEGVLALHPGMGRGVALEHLTALRGIGPWTAGYTAMRGLGDPDVMLEGDLGVRKALAVLGGPQQPRAIAARAQAWRPWRSYAVIHLWRSLEEESHAAQ